jgi:cytochrome c oxidase subunit 2
MSVGRNVRHVTDRTDEPRPWAGKALGAIGSTLPFGLLAFALQWGILALGASLQTASPKVIEITAKKYQFDPAEVHVKKGEHIELRVHSADETHGIKIEIYPDGTSHNSSPGLVFANPGVNGKVEKNVDQILDFVAAEPGTYEFKCAKLCGMGHGRMQGKLIVDPS